MAIVKVPMVVQWVEGPKAGLEEAGFQYYCDGCGNDDFRVEENESEGIHAVCTICYSEYSLSSFETAESRSNPPALR